MKLLRALAASVSYFSILPCPTFDERPDGDAIAFLPLVGAVIGGLSGLCGYGVYLVTHLALAAAISAWIASIALSGAIHIDGFLDCCDGLFAMTTPERRVEIMRDPHHGTYAIAGMTMLTVVWLYALTLIPAASLPEALALAAVIARFGALGQAMIWPNQDSGRRLRPSFGAALAALVTVACVLAWLERIAGIEGFLVLVPVVAISTIAGVFAWLRNNRRLNGDCYGAIVVVTEVAVLLALPYVVPMK